MIRAGVLVEVIDAKDQPLWTKNLIGKIGLVIEPIIYWHSSKQYSVWKILIEESVLNMHVLYLKEITL